MVKVSDDGRHAMSSSPVPLKIRRQRCTLNLSRAETSTRCVMVMFMKVALRSDTILTGDGPHHFKPRSSDEGDIGSLHLQIFTPHQRED
ncbi:hypothetical protein TNCV_4355681 [Trichonephila clavipes]|nr:hypothetical protein TNCV_4355681 [Trichonephila clavipes]